MINLVNTHDINGMIVNIDVNDFEEHVTKSHGISIEDAKRFIGMASFNIPATGRRVDVVTIDTNEIIGKDYCVRTDENSVIAYYTRGNRTGKSRMVLNQDAEDTSFVTIVVGVCGGDYGETPVVYTMYPGKNAPREPWDASLNETDKAEAEEFWASHALVPTPEQRAEIEKEVK